MNISGLTNMPGTAIKALLLLPRSAATRMVWVIATKAVWLLPRFEAHLVGVPEQEGSVLAIPIKVILFRRSGNRAVMNLLRMEVASLRALVTSFMTCTA